MTDPSNVREIIPIVKPSEITSMAYEYDRLWIGDDKGRLVVCAKPRNPEQSEFYITHQYFWTEGNYFVKKILPNPSNGCVVIHYANFLQQSGPVEILHPSGIKNRLKAVAMHVLTSNEEKNSVFCLINDKNMTFYKFIGDVFVQFDSFQADQKITIAEMCSNSILYYSGSNYFQYYFREKKLKELSPSPISRPMIHQMNNNTFIIAYKEFMMATGSFEEKTGTIYQYDSEGGIPDFFFGKDSGLYQVYPKYFIRSVMSSTTSKPQVFVIPQTKICCMYGNELIVVTENAIKVVGSVPPPERFAKKIITGQMAEVEKIFNTLSADQRSQSMIGTFAILWESGKHSLALTLASKYLWIGDPREFIILFPDIIIDPPLSKRVLVPKGELISASQQPLVKQLMEVLEFTRKSYLEYSSPQFSRRLKPLTTALAQVYSILHKTRELDSLILEGDGIDIEVLGNFLKNNVKNLSLGPAFAVYCTRTKEIQKALSIWRQLDEKKPDDPLFITEASYSLKFCDDSKLFSETLEWIYKKSPLATMNALKSTIHDSDAVLAFLDTHPITNGRIEYLDFLVLQNNYTPRPDLISEAIITFIRILSSINEPKFDMKTIEFTDAFQKKSPELKDAVRAELTKKCIVILEQHSQFIHHQQVLDILTPNVDRQIRYCIYRVSERYDEAIKVMMEGTSDPPFAELQDLCRKSPNPPTAFASVLNKLDKKALFSTHLSFIDENLPWMNPIDVVRVIPRDSRVKSVSDLLRKSYALLLERQRSLEIQISSIKPIQIESNFRLSQQQCEHCTIDGDTKCTSCGRAFGNIQLVLAPDGSLYHLSDKPNL